MKREASIKLLPWQLEPFNIIPLKDKSYNPNPSGVMGWKEYQVVDYPRNRLVQYYGNLGVILGKYEEGYKPTKKSSKDTLALLGIAEEVEDYREYYLVQVDIDNPEHYQYFQDLDTFTVKSGKGYHVYLISEDPINTLKDYPAVGIETRSIGGLSVVPPSIHPDTGNEYQVEKDLDIKEVKNAYDFCSELIPEDLRTPLKQPVTTKKRGKHKFSRGKDRNLDEEVVDRIVRLFKGMYTQGDRDHIVFSLSGWLRKAGVTLESCLEVINALATTYNDEEIESRLIVAKRTYEEVGIDEILGSKGVKEYILSKDPVEGNYKFLMLELILDGSKSWQDKEEVEYVLEVYK